jgi:hypothetical protein
MTKLPTAALTIAGVLCGLLFAVQAHATPSDGMVVGTTKIFDSGPASDRYNLVLLAEGYQDTELSDFADDAQDFLEFFLETPPFTESCRAFNVWRIDVSSTDSGADDPKGMDDFCSTATEAEVDTYFDATFCSDGKARRLLGVNNGTVINVLNSEVPEWDQGLVIVNSNIYGGKGGDVGTTSLDGTWENIAIHEFGHSGFGLADEYEYYLGCSSGETDRDNHPMSEPVQPNVTVETDPMMIKWSGFIDGGTAIPTTENADCSVCDSQGNPFPGMMVVGLYEGAHYYHCDAFRPTFNCMMRNFDDFCPVCTQRINDVIQPYKPANQAPICDANGPYVKECTGNVNSVTLDGSGSSDEGCILTFEWTGPFMGGTSTAESPTVQFTGLGVFDIDLTVSDGQLDAACASTVTVQDTTPPQITAPADVQVECDAHDGTAVDIGDAIASDLCDDTLDVSNDAPAVFPLGVTVVTWTATDSSGNQSSDTQTVTVVDTTPPDLSLSVTPDSLWPPNHKMVDIVASIEVTDICDPNPQVRLVSITSSEPDNDISDGATTDDIQQASFGTDDREFQLRSERQGRQSGRVYTITYEAEDMSGNTTPAEAMVSVAHDKGK